MNDPLSLHFSYYSIVCHLKDSEEFFVTNGVTGAVLKLCMRVYEAIRAKRIDLLLPSEVHSLCDAGIIVGNPDDQATMLHQQYSALQHSLEVTRFTVMPTTACNLRCSYCYERHSGIQAKSMTPDTVRGVISFLCDVARTVKAPEILIKFYGGEPLMEIETCREISLAVKEAGRNQGKTIHLWLVSNGTLIESKGFADGFGIEQVEIAIDGPRERHDRLRRAGATRPTYDRIMSSIKYLMDRGIHVALRLNVVDASDMEATLKDLEDYSIQPGKGLSVVEAMVHDDFFELMCGGGNEARQAWLTYPVCDIRKSIERCGWGEVHQTRPLFRHLVKPLECTRTMLIDPDGDLYVCTYQQGNPDFRVGHIESDGRARFNGIYDEILNRSPFEHEKCLKCAYLPRCWGGCFARSFFANGSFSAPYCGNIIANTEKTFAQSLKAGEL